MAGEAVWVAKILVCKQHTVPPLYSKILSLRKLAKSFLLLLLRGQGQPKIAEQTLATLAKARLRAPEGQEGMLYTAFGHDAQHRSTNLCIQKPKLFK